MLKRKKLLKNRDDFVQLLKKAPPNVRFEIVMLYGESENTVMKKKGKSKIDQVIDMISEIKKDIKDINKRLDYNGLKKLPK